MNTEALIQELAIKCSPVKPLRRPVVRCLQWILASLGMIGTGVLVLGPRSGSIPKSADLLLITSVLIVVSIIAAVSAFVLTVPSVTSRRFYWVLAAGLVSWLFVIIYMAFKGEVLDPHLHFLCVKRIIILSIFPGILLFNMLRRAAPIKPGTVGVLALFSVLLLSCLGLDFVCPNTGLSHALVWHILPATALSGIGLVIGRAVFQRNLLR